MTGKSFYDLDYMIEINEQRLELYMSASDKVMEKLTNIIIIYSAMSIFLVPIVLTVFGSEEKPWWLDACFLLFGVPFSISVFNTVRLIIPVNAVLLNEPRFFYQHQRKKYEGKISDKVSLEVLLKASYIQELEDCLHINFGIYKRKNEFYRNALIYVLMSIVPYLVCLGYHVSKQQKDVVHKSELVSNRKT